MKSALPGLISTVRWQTHWWSPQHTGSHSANVTLSAPPAAPAALVVRGAVPQQLLQLGWDAINGRQALAR